MNNRTIAAFILFLLLASPFLIFPAVTADPRTIIVPDDYLTIQAAIDSASDGDEVYVKSGVYNESLTITKLLSLVGENKETTIVTGEGNTALLIKHDNVDVSGFTFRRPSTMRWYYGIHLLSVKNCNVFGNKVESTFNGIWLVGSQFCAVYENTLSGDWNAISLKDSHYNNISTNQISGSHDWGIIAEGSNSNLIINNDVASSGWCGIGTGGSSPSKSNLIAQNTVTQSGAIGIGITSSDSTSNKIVANTITGTNSDNGGDFAIRLAWGSNLVVGNRLVGNQGGIFFESSSNNTVHHNLMENIAEEAISIHSYPNQPATGNVIYENNIKSGNVTVTGNLQPHIWDVGFRGNFWSSYTGTDANGDGIGDTAYVIDSVNVDHYPLISPINVAIDLSEYLPSPTLTSSPFPSPSPTPTSSPSPVPTPYSTITPRQSASPSPFSKPSETPSYTPPLSLQPAQSSKTQDSLQPATLLAIMGAVAALIVAACAIAFLLRKRRPH